MKNLSVMQHQERINNNKNQLTEYLSDFDPVKAEEFMNRFSDGDFDCGYFVFRGIMKTIIKMPQIGKSAKNYWISRGWSEEESKNKRMRIKKDPTTSPMNINFWIKGGLTKEDAIVKIKSQRKMNKEYWIERGFSEDNAIIKSNEFQIENSDKLVNKYKNDSVFKKDMRKKQSTCVEYWIENGYSENDAKIKVIERQSTFSLKKCIEKNGKEIGHDIWEKRQHKWMKSLSESEYNGSDGKDSKSVVYFKEKYGEEWVDNFIERTSFKDKSQVKSFLFFKSYMDLIDHLLLEKCPIHDIYLKINNKLIASFYNSSFEEMYNYLLSKSNYIHDVKSPDYFKNKYGGEWVSEFISRNTFKNKEEVELLVSYNSYFELVDYLSINFSVTETVLKIQNALISAVYNTTFDEMFNYLISLPLIIKSKFGYMRYFNGHLCRSDGEFSISKFLVEKNIKYEYEKGYPKSKTRCDFYLNDYDIYVEYLGMITIKKEGTSYLEKYENKRLFCLENNLKHIFSSDINDIKKMIENEIYNNIR